MPIAILDPAAGISGDMTLGALLDVGAPVGWLEELPARLGFPQVAIRVEPVTRSSIAATKVGFEIPGHDGSGGQAHGEPGHGRHVGEMIELVRRAPLSEWVRSRAVRAFELIGQAEGTVHGCEPDRVHLHEVGAIDAVLDIVGAIEGFERLGVRDVYHRPAALGTGWVETAHGKLPVPAPATALLMEGLEVAEGSPAVGESTTPTGAALLRVLSQGPPPDRWRLTRTGWGAGARNPDGYPNALRLILAEVAAEAGVLEVIATDIDDLNPEYLEPLRQAALDAGAVDCVAWPTQGKKGRVSVRVEALAPPGSAARVVDAVFRHSTTTGVRRGTFLRETLPRRELTVELTPGVRVRTKVRDGPGGARAKAEYEDVVQAAAALGRPPLDVAREAEREAETRLAREN